jgi:hypothetical protein
MWADADRERERPLRVTIVDRRASGRFSGLLLDHPAVVERLRAETIDLDFVEPSAPAVLRLQWLLANDPPSSTFVAFDDDARSLSAALLVRSAITDPESTVIARTSNAAGLGVLVADDGLGGGLGITTFPLVERTCRVDVLSLGVTEQVARSLHATYLAEVAAGTRGGGERAVPWDQLSEEAKESNRDAADGIFETLRAVGCDLIPVRRWIDDRCGLSDDDIDAIARLEHERWRAEREAEGWHVGAERDAEARTNPLLVPWIDLPDSAKASARDSAEDLPMTLARAGFEIVRIDRRAAVATPGGTDRSAG